MKEENEKKESYIYDDVKNEVIYDNTEGFKLSFGQLTQYRSDPPYYEWIINDQKFVFNSAAELSEQENFILQCMDSLRFAPYKFSEYDWNTILKTAFENIKVIEIDIVDDISNSYIFMCLLYDFFENNMNADLSKEKIFTGMMVYRDEAKQNYIFKSKILLDFLKEKNFTSFNFNEIHYRLKNMDGEPVNYFVEKLGKNIRAWKLPFKALEKFKD